MPDLSVGKILVADHEGVYLIKFVGDVRLNLCIPFDNFIQSLIIKEDFCSIVFDFSQAEGLDSTTLGLIAKLAVKSREIKTIKASLIGANDSVYRLLDVTGITDLCNVIESDTHLNGALEEAKPIPSTSDAENEDKVRKKVLEAHKVLVSLNETNRESFKDLIKTLSQI